MVYPPRLLRIDDEAGALTELQGIGVDPAGAGRMASKMVRRLVRIPAVPCRAANILKQEMLALGGDAAVARGSVACSVPSTDVILIGSLKKMRQLCDRLPHQPFGLADLAGELIRLLERIDHPPTFLLGLNCRLDLTLPRIMGILNVTPDSFSDGGRFLGGDAAIRQALAMAGDGADLIDIGGESTRPGAPAVSEQQELDRVLPVVEALRREVDLPISIDTTKSAVARDAIAAGGNFINDISGLSFDPMMAGAVAASGAGLFVMHTRGRPETMQQNVAYADLMAEVTDGLQDSLERAIQAGVPEERLAVDPGIGFGKDAEGNLEILRRLSELQSLGRPVLLGTSRKGFIGAALGQVGTQERLFGTLSTVALGVERGAAIFRVHDVKAAREAALVAWSVCHQAMPKAG